MPRRLDPLNHIRTRLGITSIRDAATTALNRLSVAPFQGAIGTASMIAALAVVAGFAPPSITTFPVLLVTAWAGLLAAGSPLMLAGLVLLAPRIEQAGLALLAASYGIYGGALLILHPTTSITAAALYVLLAAACLLRIRVLSRALDAIAAAKPETEN